MGGKGGGATVPKELQNAAQSIIDIGEEQLGIGLPLLEAGGGIAEDVLKSGSSPTLRPAILSSLEATKRRGSEEIQSLEEGLTRRGVTGTQFQEAVAPERVKLANEVAQIPSSFTLPIFQQATQQALGQTELGLQSLQSGATAGASGSVPGRQSGGVGGALSGGVSGAATGFQIGGPWGALAGGVLGAGKGSK
jgi:hypothetical protein